MPYAASNFIYNYALTSRTIRIVDVIGNISFSINVCNYQKASVYLNTLRIILEDTQREYIVDFNSPQEALRGLSLLKQAVDTLRANCAFGNTGPAQPPPAGTPIPISYLVYKSLQQGNNLVPLQYYDVTDTTGLVIDNGKTMRLLAMGTDDFHPEGEFLDSSKAKIAINTKTDDVLFYQEPSQRLTYISTSYQQQTADAGSNNIIVKNDSKITASGAEFIELENQSVATVVNSNFLKILNGCSITVVNADHCTFDNIQQDLSSIGFNISNVIVNQTDSIGKLGTGSITGDTDLLAYNDFIDQVANINSDGNNLTVTLTNPIPQTNSIFKIKYAGSGSSNTILINNSDASLLYTITDKDRGNWVVFKYIKPADPIPGHYEFVNIDYGEGLSPYTYLVSSITDGQTDFVLPVAALNPLNLMMYVNGQKRTFGLDFTYSSSTQTATYTNRDFTIASTDEVEFIIY